MARIQLNKVTDYLRTIVRGALEDAVRNTAAQPSAHLSLDEALYREFQSAIAKRGGTWVYVPDRLVRAVPNASTGANSSHGT